ncbi:MAG: flavodoxin-dependent (E)-4-hydroxy-3-methylbut-2-enyl-diphosphate synthase [Treponema sp.]|jgi:(E)-4-hydroxy-3-methylbut-2-enyl-diphosphate synthase|nr:flavodoxin-dependent (E)-4-hydroxy-3-methylbut-2-enyl-diphosphate synthase [Treponema sp.]
MERISNTVKIGGFSRIRPVQIGGNSPVVIQTMWKDRLSLQDIDDNLVKRIEALGAMGCGLLRFAVPDIQSAEAVGSLAGMVSMPLVADIHFDYKIALRCMDFPIAKIRINPGNIGSKEKTAEVLKKAADRNIPIRIGVNAGSLPQDLRKRVEEGMDAAMALVQSAERELEVFEEFGFCACVVSMKASGIADTIKANRILSQRTAFPLHLGVTEAGPLTAGVARNTTALVTLLAQGIGDTIRVSLSDTVENEVIAGREIIRAAAELAEENVKLKSAGVNIISCPRCGRHGFDTHGFLNRWMTRLYSLNRDITVAVMGCEVNGPVEAKDADLGITGAGDKVLIFRNGKIVKTIGAQNADKAFEEELKNI